MHKDNGVLAMVRGEEVGAASRQLPEPTDAQPEHLSAETDSVHLGRVRITFRRVVYRHHKARLRSWLPVHAEAVGDQKSPAGSA